MGTTGAQGPVGVVARWTWYRDFRFDSSRANFRTSEASKASEVALFMRDNPSLKFAIDGSMSPGNPNLSDQRVRSVRTALIEAGVPASKIQTGTFDGAKLPHDGRVAVLFRTAGS